MKTSHSFNLIKDWYFCCCVGCSHRTTGIFLTSLEFLDNPESEGSLKSTSLKQIFLIEDVNMQLYVLPQILIAIHEKASQKYSLSAIDIEQVRTFYISLINKECKNNAISNNLKALLNACITPPKSLTKLFEKLDFKLFSSSFKDDVRTSPYRDIQKFFNESMFSVLISFLANNDEHFREKIKPENCSSLEPFYYNALNSNYGRFVFGLIFCLPSEMHVFEIGIENLWNGTLSDIPEYEPDILSWYAYQLFLIPINESENCIDKSKQFVSDKIFVEMKSLLILISLVHNNLLMIDTSKIDKRKKDINSFLFKTGILKGKKEEIEGYVLTIPYIFWQGILIDLIIKVDTDYAYDLLSEIFKGICKENKNEIILSGFDSELSKKIRKIYGQLYEYKSDGHSFLQFVNRESGASCISGDLWSIVTPVLNISSFHLFKGNYTIYNNYENSTVLLIQSCTSIPIIRLLQRKDNIEVDNKYLDYLVGLQSFIMIYSKWLNIANKKKSNFDNIRNRLSYPLTGLLTVTQGVITAVGSGSIDSISPRLFVDNLIKNLERNTLYDYFNLYIYPNVLLNWVSVAMQGMSDTIVGKDRWRPLIRNVLDFFVKGGQIKIASAWSLTLYGVISKLFYPEIALPERVIKESSWKNFVKKKEISKISPRNFLITTNEIVFNDWLTVKYLNGFQNLDNSDAITLICCMEGLTCICNSPNYYENEILSALYNDYEYSIQKIESKDRFDRFTRNKVLQFFETLEILKCSENTYISAFDWRKLQELTVAVLLEFGALHELILLLNLIFPFHQNGVLSSDQRFHHLQKIVINILIRISFYSSEYGTTNPDFPFDIWLDLQKKDLFASTLSKIAFFYWHLNNKENLIELKLSKSIYFLLKQINANNLNQIKDVCTINTLNKEEIGAINTIIYNPNRKKYRIFSQQIEFRNAENKIYNLFSLSNIPTKKIIRALSFITDITGPTMELNAGLNTVLSYHSTSNFSNYEVGEPIIANIENFGNKWVCNCIEKDPPINNCKIQELTLTGNELLSLLNKKKREIQNRDESFRLLLAWFSDLSFMDDKDQMAEDITALIDVKTFYPISFRIESLLTSNIPRTTVCENQEIFGFTLSFVQYDTIRNCFLFSSNPGQLYELFPDDFTDDTYRQLKHKLEVNSFGLLVTLFPGEEDGWIKLSIDSGIGFKCNNKRYINLECPFDTRNVDLFNLINIEEDERFLKAKAINNNWFLCDKQNNPINILVSLSRDTRTFNNEVRFKVIDWDPFNRMVTGEPDMAVSLRRINNSYDYLFSIKEGNIVKLIAITNKYKNEINVDVQEGFEVKIPNFSLTMLPISNNFENTILQRSIVDRKAIIENVYQKKIKVNLKLTFINNVIGDFSEAVIIEKYERDQTKYTIWWKKNNQENTAQVSITQNNEEIIQLGDIIENYHGNFQLKRNKIEARAIWKICEGNAIGELAYLGQSTIDGQITYLAESKNHPGKLVILPDDPSVCPLQYSNNQGKFISYVENLSDWKLPANYSFYEKNGRALVTLYNRYNERITGFINTENHIPTATQLDTLLIDLEPIDGEVYKINRIFELEAPIETGNYQKVTNQVSIGMLIFQFEKALSSENNGELINDYITSTDLVKIPSTTNEQDWKYSDQHWTDLIRLGKDEGVYIQSRSKFYDPKDCLFKLIPFENPSEGYFASFKKVNSKTLSDFFKKEKSFLKKITNDRYLINRSLFYEGSYTEFQGEIGRLCLFEYGYGKSLLIPIDMVTLILFNNKIVKLSDSSNLIFHGDEIVSAELLRHGENWALQIEVVKIQYCESTQVFHEGNDLTNNGIVHLVYYNPSNKKIIQVTGLGKNGIDYTTNYRNSGAKLSAITEERISNNDKSSSEVIPLYAKIDTQKYIETNGKNLEFICMDWQFDTESKTIVSDLNGTMLFVKATQIIETNNDFILNVEPITKEGLDIPKVLSELTIQRRNFSCDEETLSRYFLNAQDIVGKIFIVKLFTTLDGKGLGAKIFDDKNFCSKIARHEKELESYSTGRLQTYVTYLKEDDSNNSFIVEFKPGILFKINKVNWNLPENLCKGDLLKIHFSKKEMRRASFGDEYYIGEAKRTVVLLPMNSFMRKDVKNSLINNDNNIFRGNASLTIGSFPNLTVRLWPQITNSEVLTMLGSLYRYADIYRNNGRIYIKKIIDQNYGKIQWKDYTPMLHTTDGGTQETELDSMQLSFMDKPLTEIIQRTLSVFWHFHDKKTPILKIRSNEIISIQPDIPLMSTCNGPIFFYKQNNGKLSLRFSVNNKRNFGYPVREIIHYLRKIESKQAIFYFVGLEIERSKVEGLWVEMTPGRIVEIPVELISINLQGVIVNSTNFDWKLLSTGDELIITLRPVIGQDREQLILDKWIPNSRGLLGQGTLIAPVQEILIDENTSIQTGIVVGESMFQLILPYNIKIEIGEIIHLDLPSNKLEINNSEKLLNNLFDLIVFLKFEGDRPCIAGFENYKVLFDSNGWDSLISADKLNYPSMFSIELSEIITSFGTLPVTIEEFNIQKKHIKISRRLQQGFKSLPIHLENFTIGKIVGMVLDEKLIMRFGNRIISIDPETLINGIHNIRSEERKKLVLKLFELKNNFTWCCKNQNKQLKSGIYNANESNYSNLCKVHTCLSDELGILLTTSSMEMIYVSPDQAILCKPSNEILRNSFIEDSYFPVAYINGAYSIIKSRTILDWFNRLNINDRLDVEIMSSKKQGGKMNCVVKHKIGAITQCDFYISTALEQSTTITVEVTNKEQIDDKPYLVLKGGEFPLELDYPFEVECEDNFDLLNNNLFSDELSSNDSFNSESILSMYGYYHSINYRESNSNNELILKLATYIDKSIMNEETISALPLLCAVSILFNTIGDNWEVTNQIDIIKSVQIIHSLKLRLQRNYHVEILSREANPDWSSVSGGMKGRFDKVAKRFTFARNPNIQEKRSTFNEEEIYKIKAFCTAVLYKDSKDLRPCADGLLASMGELKSNSSFIYDSLIINEFVRICNILPPGSYLTRFESKELWKKISTFIDDIIVSMKKVKRFIPLLPINKV